MQQVKLEPNEYILTDANNEIITKNFYKVGDTLTLKASFDENKVKENEIKWVYKAMKPDEIQMFHQQDSKDKNPYSTQLHPVELDEIPKDTLQILQDSKTFFSNTPAYTIKNIKSNEAEPENIYKGKTLEITIPQGFENKQIAIFAYKNEPNWKVCQIIRINDYPQITIDCTLAETLRANARNDEISRLGWGVSYICQRLWHDNPANAKELGELIYIDSRQEDFIDSIPNETMKEIVKEILPRVEMREFAREIANQCPKVKSQIQQNDKNNLRFYVELDWDKFYMKFPLMKGLEKEILSIYLAPTTYGYQGISNPILPTYKGKILTKGFLTQIQDFINSKKNILKKEQENKFEMRVSANLLEIARNPKKTNVPNVNNKIFSIAKDSTNLQECEKLLNDIKPSDLRRHQMQYYGISDSNFGKEYLLNFEEQSNQAIALYALSGKFQIYYVLDSFEVERINEKEIAIYPTQIKAYIDDSFDFRDNPNQTVGVWNYENIEFDSATSAAMALKYWWNKEANKKEQIQLALKYQQNRANNLNRGAMYYHLYNLDYQQTQKYFNLGLDFLVTSPTFKNIKIPNNLDTRKLFGIIVKA
ncbi:DUF6402 family protein [Helicobacter fennelliae]|uniref:DUF6402 family protein n=1 Tax=Helicobacter fennelliae TaxID=215 RepID=UPI0011BFE562|nr:DUF6402 family protein [Helicobacter fennelliae]